MLVRWKTKKYSDDIERVECSRETDKSVWVLEVPWQIGNEKPRPPVERRRDRMTDYDQFHDSWEAAHAYLLQRAESKLRYAQSNLQDAQETLRQVQGMQAPQKSEAAAIAG